MMRPNWAVFLLAITIPAAGMCAESKVQIRCPERLPENKTLALCDAINLSLKNLPAVRQAAAQVEFQQGVLKQVRSRLLPSISVAASVPIAATGAPGTQISIVGDQLIYDFGRTRAQVTQAEQQFQAAVSSLETASSDAVFNVKQAYYTVLRTSQLVSVFEANVRAQDQHVAQAQARLDAGLAPRADVLRAAAAAASARVDLVAARNDADQARADLDVAMGVDVRSTPPVAETSEPDIPLPSLDDLVNKSETDRPEMRTAMAQVAASAAALKAAKTGNLPEITTSVSNVENFGASFGSSTSWQWLANVRWTPFDFGFTRGAIIQAQSALIQNEEELYAVRQTVSRDVVAARLNLIAAQEALVSADAEVASAAESQAAAVGRYEAGVGIFLDVIDSQSALLKAQVDQAVARYGQSTARAQLEHAIGSVAAWAYETAVGGLKK